MTRVYVVTDGCYSDYRIMGVFDEKHESEAIRYMREINSKPGGYASVEEYAMNSTLYDNDFCDRMKSLGFNLYDVTMGLDGNDTTVNIRKFLSGDSTVFRIESKPRPDISQLDELGYYKMVMGEPTIYSTVWAKSEEHAVKIVNEKRTMWRAYGYMQEK